VLGKPFQHEPQVRGHVSTGSDPLARVVHDRTGQLVVGALVESDDDAQRHPNEQALEHALTPGVGV